MILVALILIAGLLISLNALSDKRKRTSQQISGHTSKATPLTGMTKSAIISHRKFVAFNILTLGVYRAYWGWRLWESVRLSRKRTYTFNSSLRAICLQISGLFLFPQLQRLAESKGYRMRYGSAVIAWLCLLLPLGFGAINIFMVKNMGVMLIVSLASIAITSVILLPIIDMHNHYTLATNGMYYHKTHNRWLIGYLGLSFVLIFLLLGYSHNFNNNKNDLSQQIGSYSSVAGNFTILFPGHPFVISRDAIVDNQKVTRILYVSFVKGQEFGVNVYILPDRYDSNKLSTARLSALVKYSSEGFAKAAHGKVISDTTESISSSKTIANEAQYSLNFLFYRRTGYVRAFYIGNIQYYIYTSGATKTNFENFANSFTYRKLAAHEIDVNGAITNNYVTSGSSDTGAGNSTLDYSSGSGPGNSTMVVTYK